MRDLETEKLWSRYQQGISSPEENAVIESWLLNYIEYNDWIPDEKEMRNAQKAISIGLPVDVTSAQGKSGNWASNSLTVAATIIILLSIAVLVLNKNPQKSAAYTTDINPGGNKATLQLANGEIITLNDAKNGVVINPKSIAYNDGAIIDNTANTGTQVITTPKGGQYQIELPDGSKVWLNAASTLEYSVSLLESGERRVKLGGEAYFEVVKDKKRSFIVETNQQTVQVLGTHFNINAYGDDEGTKTTLIEGSVKVSLRRSHPGLGQDDVVLKPNEQSVNVGGAIQIKQIDPNEAIAWKNGEFAFNNEPLASIMPKLARWYDVEVSYQNNEIAQKRLNGSISKFGKISEILAMLELTGEVHFKIEGRRVTVMP